jgi:hypothetical protein
MGSRRSRRSAATGAALRILVWAALFYALIVFAVPCALSVITGSEVERPTHTSLDLLGYRFPHHCRDRGASLVVAHATKQDALDRCRPSPS